MRYLQDFLAALRPDEQQMLRQTIPFSTTELRVFEYLLRSQAEGNSEVAPLSKMTTTHFDKLCSQLLSKCYEAFPDIAKEPILATLAKRGAHELYLHELHKQERLLRRSKATEAELEGLYYQALNSYLFFEARLFRQDVWEHISSAYCRYSARQEAATIVRIRSLIRRIHLLRVQGNRGTALLAVEEELLQLYEELQDKNWAESLILLCRALAEYYTTRGAVEQIIYWWTKALEALRLHPDIFPEAKLVVQGSLAQAYTAKPGGINKALRLLDAMWKEEPNVFARNGHLNQIYFRVLLWAEKATRALQLLSLRFGTNELLGNAALRPMDVVDYALYYILQGNYDTAKKFVHQGLSIKQGGILGAEAELRFIEIASFFLSGETEFALDLCTRTAKYFSAKKAIPDVAQWKSYLKLLRAVILFAAEKKVLPAKQAALLQTLSFQTQHVMLCMVVVCAQRAKLVE